MRIVCTSDTHFPIGFDWPDGDVLIHAGDHTMNGEVPAIKERFMELLHTPYDYKVVIGGNHDFGLAEDVHLYKWAKEQEKHNFYYLAGESAVINGVKFFGAPWVPNLPGWAFNYPEKMGRVIWEYIPDDVQVLVTHGPASGILDKGKAHYGCPYLLDKVVGLAQKKLKLHVFGHIHESYGRLDLHWPDGELKYIAVNAAHCDYPGYNRVNPPIVVEI